MRLANEEAELHRLGAEIVGVSVDSPGRNEALRRRWHLPFPIVSDPGGEDLLQPLDLWNPGERGGIGWPAVLVFAPDGREVHRMRSRDFADRPTDDDVFDAVRRLGLTPVDPGAAEPVAEPEEHPDALRTEAFGPYFRGIRFGTIALSGRLRDEADVAEAVQMSEMAASFLAAWKLRRDAATPD